MTKDEYKKKKREYIKLEHGVEDYVEFSMTPQDPEDILFRALLTEESGDAVLCFSYICEKQKLTPGILDDIIFINSGFMDFQNWNFRPDVVRYVVDIINADDQWKAIEKVVEGKCPYPEIRAKCQKMLDQYRKQTANKLRQYQKDHHRLQKIRGDIRTTIENDDWLKNYDKITVMLKQYREQVEKELRVAKIILTFRQCRPIQDRLDWKTLVKRKDIPKEYFEMRKEIVKEGLRNV